MTRREIVLLLIICLVPFVAGGIVVASQESKAAKDLPKTVGLTEVQRLKDENLQLKMNALQNQMAALNTERSELLKGALKVAGVEGPDIERYQYDQVKFTFNLMPEKENAKATPTPGVKPPTK